MRFILLLLLLLASCESPPRRTTSSYHGAVSTDQQSCSQEMIELVCTDELEETRKFKTRCLDQNRKIIKCDCDEYLCVDKEVNDTNEYQPLPSNEQDEVPLGNILNDDKEYIGVDYYGNTRTCKPYPPEFFCTAEFTKEDNYAFECRKDGIDIVYCGCHDPICLD